MNGTSIKILTTDQKLILKQFREDVRDILEPEHDDYFLLRWLRARQFDATKAETMLRKSWQWRKQIGADSLLTAHQSPEVVLKYVPSLFLGFDKEGSTVRLLPQGNVDFKGLVSSVLKQDLVKSLALTYEYDLQQMKMNNEKTGNNAETFVFILDYAGFSIKQVASKAVMDVVFALLRVFEANYPERLKTAFAINVPPLFSTLFAAVKPLLAEETRKKFQFLGKDCFKEALLESIDPHVLPVYLGGTRVDENGDPKCSLLISPGGPIPESYYIRNRNVRRLSDCAESSRAFVEARSDYPVEIHIANEESLIEWEIESDGEVGIGLLYLDKITVPGRNEELYPVEEISPVERMSCHLGVEAGTFFCQRTGFYILQFDNSFSKFRPKNIVYKYNINCPTSNL